MQIFNLIKENKNKNHSLVGLITAGNSNLFEYFNKQKMIWLTADNSIIKAKRLQFTKIILLQMFME